MDLELYHLEKTPKSLVEKIEATKFSEFFTGLTKGLFRPIAIWQV